MENKIILRLMKSLDRLGRMVIPLEIRNALGEDYYLEYYEDYIKLIPIKKEK